MRPDGLLEGVSGKEAAARYDHGTCHRHTEAGRGALSIVNVTATELRTNRSIRDDTIETGRRFRLALLAQNARRDALSANPLHLDNARLGGGHRYSSGPGRADPGARLPRRGGRRGDDRLDVSDQAARKAVPSAFNYTARSHAGIFGRATRGLRRRMAHQADVPLSMEIRGRYRQGVARARARPRSVHEPRAAGQGVAFFCRSSDRTARAWSARTT